MSFASSAPVVSILICTRNRADSLKLTLESLSRVAVPPGWTVELLVVDNGSTDATSSVVRSARIAGLAVHQLSEPRAGKGYAYNAGIAAARGSVLLFTDDDVRVPENWITGMAQPLLEGAADALAGAVIFPAAIAAILDRAPYSSFRDWFASTEKLDPQSPGRMVGANMAFHRRVLDRVPLFDVELGPGAMGFAEETLFTWQLAQAGFRVKGALGIAVEHHFDSARLTPDSLRELARKMGRCDAYILHHWIHRNRHLLPLRIACCRLRLAWSEWVDRRTQTGRTGPSPRTILAEKSLAFALEFRTQRLRPRKYQRRGLAPNGTSLAN